MQTLTYEETVTAIENKRRFGNLKGVEISKIMLEQLGHPEKDLRIIHIAGTNGKGSVSAFLRSVFECAGLKTGMFTSPHLVDFRERIQVQGDMISKEDIPDDWVCPLCGVGKDDFSPVEEIEKRVEDIKAVFPKECAELVDAGDASKGFRLEVVCSAIFL